MDYMSAVRFFTVYDNVKRAPAIWQMIVDRDLLNYSEAT